MSNFIQPENPVFRFLTRFFDIMLLNFLFLISSIPIVTIGASLSATYSICFKIINNEDPSIAKEFFNSFKANFKQSTFLWLPLLLAFVFFGTDLYIIYNIIDDAYEPFQVPVWIIIVLLLSIYIYSFPQIGRFDSNKKKIIKNSILISLSNIPYTIFIIVLHLFIIFFVANSYKNLIIAFSIVLFFGAAGLIYIIAIYINKIFDKINNR